MAPPAMTHSGSRAVDWTASFKLNDFGPHNLDERTRNALEAFENAVRPAGLAATGSDGEKVRSRSAKLLDKECRGLVAAGEQLLASVAKLGDCPLLVILLQKLPRLLTRQALMIALADVTPELVDRECLKSQVGELQKQQLSSTTRYLQELGAVRSQLRHLSRSGGNSPVKATAGAGGTTVAATLGLTASQLADPDDGGETPPAKSASMASVGSAPSRRGSKSGLNDSLTKSDGRRLSIKIPMKPGGSSRRASFAEEAETVGIEAPPDDPETLEPKSSPSIQSSTSITRRGRRATTLTMAAAASAATAFRRTSQAGTAAHDLEVGAEFGDVHHYMWDAVEHLDKGLQVIVCKVIAEKLQCFKTQKEATSLAELKALCKRMESYLKGTAAEEHERHLQEVLGEMNAKDAEIRHLTETIQANAETAEEGKRKLLKTMDEKDKLRDSIQRELVETQAKLESSQLKLQEVTQQVSKLKEAEALKQRELHALQKERKKVVHFSHKTEGGTANIKDFFHHYLPKLVSHLSKELRDTSMQQQLMETIDLLQRDYSEAEKKHQSVISRAKSTEQEMADLSSKTRKLEQWKASLEEQNAALQERLAELENDMVQLQSNFLDAIHKAPAYISLREEHEILKCECEGILVRSQMLQAELNRKDEEKAQMQGQLEEMDGKVAMLEDEIKDVAASQLHPTQVAQLRADLKRTRHECEALTNTNEALRKTMAALQEKLEKPTEGEDTLPEEVSLIKDMCSRTVHNRLYEDAVRRQDRDGDSPAPEHAHSWAGIAALPKRPHSAAPAVGSRKHSPGSSPSNRRIARSRSEPASRIVQHLLQTNAQSLRDTLEEPLFHHNLRLPVSPARPAELSNLPGRQMSPTSSATQQTPSVTPKSHDFAELSNIVSEIVPRSQHHHVSPVATGHSRPPSLRSGACSRFGTESPSAFSPRLQRETTPEVKTPRLPSDGTDPPAKRGNFAEAVAELQAENQRSRPPSAGDVKGGSSEGRTTPVVGTLRNIFDPKAKDEELPRPKQAMLVGVKTRSRTNSPQQLPERAATATPRLTYPRPHPRVAASLLPTVRPKSARPVPLVPFMSTVPRPHSCDP